MKLMRRSQSCVHSLGVVDERRLRRSGETGPGEERLVAVNEPRVPQGPGLVLDVDRRQGRGLLHGRPPPSGEGERDRIICTHRFAGHHHDVMVAGPPTMRRDR
jgi:hypothetical protein